MPIRFNPFLSVYLTAYTNANLALVNDKSFVRIGLS